MKIFLCSTSFDLEDLRALAVDRFRGKHEFIHFEDAAFPSRRGLHSHDQCIEAVKQADVVICIVDRRYGGHYRGKRPVEFPDQSLKFKGTVAGVEQALEVIIPTKDLSISWCELLTAYREEKYVITFARKRTMDEKATRRKNQGVSDFRSAHVDDVRVFDLLDWITKQPKDNWIIPFDNAVDFLSKLEKWLDVADTTIIPPKEDVYRDQKPITVIVEGRMDASIVRSIASKLELRRPVSVVVAEGKRSLLGNLRVYTHSFAESAGIVVLADSDSTDMDEIESQRVQFQQIISDSKRPDSRVVFAVPEIEAWLQMPDRFNRNQANWTRRVREAIHSLTGNLSARADSTPSLADFIDTLRSIDLSHE